jgi:hypothetical protein
VENPATCGEVGIKSDFDGEEKAQNGKEKIHRPQGEGREAGFR